jgi:hypothetical protein
MDFITKQKNGEKIMEWVVVVEAAVGGTIAIVGG